MRDGCILCDLTHSYCINKQTTMFIYFISDFCVGSTEDIIDDIIPCVWVAINSSGVVEIKNGHLYVDNIAYYKLSELRALSSGMYTNTNETSGDFMMEPGRTLFLFLKICNKAEICSVKLTNTVVVEGNSSELITATPGSESSHVIGSKSGSRRKRSAADTILQVTLPADMEAGQSVLITELSPDDVHTNFTSDASNDFVSYITDPDISINSTDRLLRGR